MPQLSELINRRADKKFIKKEYRSYNLTGNDEAEVTVNKFSPENNSEPTASQPSAQFNREEVNTKGNDKGNETDNDKDNLKVTTRDIGNDKGNLKITSRRDKDNELDNVKDNDKSNKDDVIFLTDSIRKLMGLQQKIFFCVIDLCSSRGELQTNPILTSDLAKIANCSCGSVKTSLIRLINKKLLLRKKGQNARGGHIILGITKEIQTAALHAQRFNLIGNDIGNNIGNILDNSGCISSSSINNINTTTNINRAGELPEEWQNINCEPVKEIGFSLNQIKTLYKLNITSPQVIQESIFQFSFGMKNNPIFKTYNSPLGKLMATLREGNKWTESGYVSPQVKAERESLAAMERELEELQAIEEQKFDTAFKIWSIKLEHNEKENILSRYPKVSDTDKFVEQARHGYMKKYFTEFVYGKN